MPHAVRLHDERAAFLALETLVWRDGPICPHCRERSRIGRLSGLSSSIGTWKCYACRKPFTVRHGTIFQNSHVPLHVWLQGLYLLMSSRHRLSSQKLGQILGISVRTAWHLKGKITAGMTAGEDDAEPLPREARPPIEIRTPLPETTSPPQPGQGVYRARYERFLGALDNLASPCSDGAFLDALHRLLSRPSSWQPQSRKSTAEQQIQLSLFDEPEQPLDRCQQNDARL